MRLFFCFFFFSFLFFFFFFFYYCASALRSVCFFPINTLSPVHRCLSSAPPRRVEARVRPSTPPTVTARTTARTRRSPSLSPGGAQASLWWNYSTGEIHNVEFLFFFPPLSSHFAGGERKLEEDFEDEFAVKTEGLFDACRSGAFWK